MSDQINQKLTTDVNLKTINIYLNTEHTPTENTIACVVSIDEAGQIVLTPESTDMSFVSATVVTPDENYTMCIRATMLSEIDDSSFNVFIDSIGQCIVQPSSELNTFVSASINDSLNLITEEMEGTMYYGYKLVPIYEGWNVYTPENELLETAAATETEAKINVHQRELAKLQRLDENLSTDESPVSQEETDTENPNQTANSDDSNSVEVSAEVLEEQLINIDEISETKESDVEELLSEITNKFTDPRGSIQCDTENEKNMSENILQSKYMNVQVEEDGSKFIISYQGIRED